jgi:hypothetical protein
MVTKGILGEPNGERRQWPRATLRQPLDCRLEVRGRVRLLDISLTGALVAGDVTLPIGTRAQLRSGIASGAFTPEVEIRRIAEASGRVPVTGLGAVFLAMDERSRRNLEQFLRKASE